ncbi:MAG: elongation factor P [Candidatus Berkelbacteria bacterium]|nr:elongation factor P [Candidatus Berkelbacteria bacterium]
MLSITDLKTGTKFTMDNDPYIVVSYYHSKMGRGCAVVKTKIKNLRTGATIDKTFQGADKVDEADLSKKTVMYLYSDETDAYFMDNESYEQFTLPIEKIGDQREYLIENASVDILYFGSEPLNIELPIKMNFAVISAPPAVKGNTASSVTKKVTLETGAIVDAPVFIKEGDHLIIDTRDGSYVERA